MLCEERPWARLVVDGQEHPHSFSGGASERHTCELTAQRDVLTLRSGLTGLTLLKTTGSGFSDFMRDQYTTLKETDDRILATSVEASWPCSDLDADWAGARQAIRQAIVAVFANQFSKSVQHTLYEMARSAFDACPLIDEIEMVMPNRHYLPAALTSPALGQNTDVFVPTSEPFGQISATIVRKRQVK